MERFVASLVFCETPLDAAVYGAAPARKLDVSGAGAGSTRATKLEAAPADRKAGAGKKEGMDTERFLASLVFCEAPLDAAFFHGSSSVKKVAVSGAGSTPAAKPAAAVAKRAQRRQPGFDPSFDGINVFDTVVMLRLI